VRAAVVVLGAGAAGVMLALVRARMRRVAPIRLLIEPYRNDRADPDALAATFARLHGLLGSRRTLAFEVHLDRRPGGAPLVWFALLCPGGLERQVQAALRTSYPNLRVRPLRAGVAAPPAALTLSRRTPPRADDELELVRPAIEPLLGAMAAAGAPATLRLILRPAPRIIELLCSSAEHRTGPLLWSTALVFARDGARARAIAGVLSGGTPRLRARRTARMHATTPRRSPWCLYRPAELARLWCLPAPEFGALPFVCRAVPLAPAPPGIDRARDGGGLLRDEHGPVTIATALRRQHTAVVGAVEQGKTSFLVASARADLRREDCAVIVLDPKGDAAAAVLSIVPQSRTTTLLDMAAPQAGFNPLAVDAAPDAIADHVVAALRGLFSEGEVRGSSDRYLRNAIIAVLACGRAATLWDVARLLEVGEAGRAFRARVADRLLELPAYAEVATFLDQELPAQLADARASTTAKLDAPANKLARVLNSPAVKRVLLNDSLRIDFDVLIERREVLVVRGALGEVGAGNVAVLMQLLLGMLDAALGRVQDRRDGAQRAAVALKIDEAPLAINAAFAQTLALKRSAGLETMACWQTDAQWEPELRDQLDALFAHRVLFATASASDARAGSALLMSEFSDQVRAGDEQLARLASPDVRLHLPRHTALASWTTPGGRERPFIATTLPLPLDRARIEWHAAAQHARGGRELRDPAPPPDSIAARSSPTVVQSPPATASAVTSSEHPTAASYGELLALDGARRMRLLTVTPPSRVRRLTPSDRDLLAWLAGARCALTSQIHRRVNPGRTLTVTQRQLKRLADRGLIARFQLHRDDGGGVPLCCAVTEHAIELLELTGRRAPTLEPAALEGLRADVHLVGWLLALEARAGDAVVEVLGPGRAAIVPRAGDPAALELGHAVRPRDFLVSRRDGPRAPVERFAAVRPAAAVDLRAPGDHTARRNDLLIATDPVDPVAVLEAYDHLLSGWWRSVERYRRAGAPPTVAMLCRDKAQALARAVLADAVLTACLAEIGVAPEDWQRPGRHGLHFVAEADLHRGELTAWTVPRLPPALRGGSTCEPLPVPFVQLPAATAAGATKPPWR
jgi:protein involved in plasmid replication-relaxation